MTVDQPNEEIPLQAVEAETTTEAPSPSEAKPPENSTEPPATAEEQSPMETIAVETSAGVKEHLPTLADLRAGMQLAGRVVNVMTLGAFVDVGVDRDGLVHISEIQRAGQENKIKRGDEIQVWVLNADQRANRLSLSLEKKTSLGQLKSGMTLNARVVRLTKFGAFVDVGAVVDGLIHADEIGRNNQEGKLKVGQEIQVFVRNVNRKSKRLSLGLGARTSLADIKAGTELDGRVARLTEFGAFMDIGCVVDGLLHVSQMPDGGPPADVLSPGETTRVRVQSVDLERRRISLTMKGIRQPGFEPVEQETEHFPTAMEIALQEAEERAQKKKRGGRR